MQLLSIESTSFGTLTFTKPLPLAPGLNICVAPNQAGKSTLLTLIEWSLYGVPSHGRRRNQALVERWSPWNGNDPQVSLTLAPQHPDWPEKAGIIIDFEEFTPRVTDLTVLRDLAANKLFTIDRNGTWDIGERLTGLSRPAMQASLIAHQGELMNLFNLERRPEHEGLRKLLTGDVADLVEDPERASLDGALRELEKPAFTLGELSKGPVQIGHLLREATNHWKMAAGELDTQRERFKALEATLAQREQAETNMGSVLAKLEDLHEEQARLELAAAHWRFSRVSKLHAQVASWDDQLKDEPWLAKFPADVQRAVDTWAANRRNVQEQINAAGAQSREAEALRLRAPYVNKVHIETEQEMIRYAERLRGVRSDIAEHQSKQERALARVEEIESYLDKHAELGSQADKLAELTELQAALAAAVQDYKTADKEVREYGEGRDKTERTRLEQLEGIIKPYRACIPEVADYLAQRDQLAKRRGELEQLRGQLEPQLKSTGQSFYYGAFALAALALIVLYFGVTVIKPLFVGVLIPVLLAVAAGWLAYSGNKRSQAVKAAKQVLAMEIVPALAENEDAGKSLEDHAMQVREQFAMATNTWNHLAELLPEYQRLSLSLEAYKQALGARDSADERRRMSWERVRTICMDTPSQPDNDWLAARLRILREIGGQRERKINEHAKLRDEENNLERLRLDKNDLLHKLKHELEPLGLGSQLDKDEGTAIEHFQAMVKETRHYKQLLREAQNQEQLQAQDKELLAQLQRVLKPIGLGELAQSDPEAALREFELRREKAAAYSALVKQLEEAQDQVRHMRLEYEEYDKRWHGASPAEREGLIAMVQNEEDYDQTATRRRDLEETAERTRRQLEQLSTEVARLREKVAKDENVCDDVEAALEAEQRTKAQLDTVRNWMQSLEILGDELSHVLRDMSSRLAPRLTEELESVLRAAPVAGVKQVGLSGRLELMLSVDGAPPGLAGDELLMRLSTGAQLQLALALRLAIASALGNERPAPLLLDEPLAELDDDRASACLRYIGKLAENTQVLLTTCHTQQYGWLAKKAGIQANILTLD